MKANYIQKGANIDYINNTGAKIAAGDVVSLTSRIGIAGTDIEAGATGSLATEGVFAIEKAASLDIAQGDPVYFSTESKTITKTATDVPAGWAIAAAAAADAEVRVKINYPPAAAG